MLFAFSHDEETMSGQGAGDTAKLVQQRYGELEVILDEGGLILTDGYPPLRQEPIALIMTSEKTYTRAKVTFSSKGGHSSMPPIDGSSVGAAMGRVLSRLESMQLQPWLPQSMVEQCQILAPKAPWHLRWLLRNAHLPLMGRVVAWALARKSPESRAMVQTTGVATLAHAGVSHNVLPQSGELTINFRLLPGESFQAVQEHMQHKVIGPDAAYAKVEWMGLEHSLMAAPKIAPSSGRHFQLLASAIQDVYRTPEFPVLVAPSLLPGGTDSKFYVHLSRHGVLRHIPIAVNRSAGGLSGVHGTNEAVSVESFRKAICVYQLAVAGFGMMVGEEQAGQ